MTPMKEPYMKTEGNESRVEEPAFTYTDLHDDQRQKMLKTLSQGLNDSRKRNKRADSIPDANKTHMNLPKLQLDKKIDPEVESRHLESVTEQTE